MPCVPGSGLDQLLQLFRTLNEVRNIGCLQAEHIGVPLRHHTGLVLAQVGLGEILAHQVLFLHDVAVADNKLYRAFQGIQQAVEVRGDVSPGPSGADHHDFDRPCLREDHAATPPKRDAPGMGTAAALMRSSQDNGKSQSGMGSSTCSAGMGQKCPPLQMRTDNSGK